ncbi:MAG: aminotransferase class V-fold PLP-dependent enzyme, partial [Oceanospirillaceae bacterium]
MKKEQAEVGNFTQYLTKVGIGLDEFQRFAHGDAQQGTKQWQQQLDIPLPETGIGLEQVTTELVEQIIPNGASIGHPGFSSYITTGGTTASTIASAAASIASPQRYTLSAFNFIEELSLKWLAQMLSLDNMLGVYSSGGSVANLVALGAARQSAFEAIGVDPAEQGMNRLGSIYASSECHHTIQRSAGVLGLGRNCVKAVKCDTRGRIDVEDLEQLIKSDIEAGLLPIAVVANAGTTNTGAIDPLLAIGQIAKRYAIWFHVDGAYGLPGILDERISHLYAGLTMADSVIVDPHKWLGAAVGVAATFVKDRGLLQRAFTQEPADYLEGSVEQNSSELNAVGLDTAQQEKDINTPLVAHSLDSFGIPYFDYGVELSSPCRGIVIWAMLKEIGVQGIRERVIRHN